MTTVLDGQTRIRNDVVDDGVLRNLVEGSSHDALKWLGKMCSLKAWLLILHVITFLKCFFY